ncbi:MAG: transaldolase family protein [bacterium]
MNIIQKLKEKYNLSIWLDYLDNELLEYLPSMVKERKIYGITTNPTIFNNALKKSSQPNLKDTKNLYEAIENVMIENVKKACYIMLPIFEETNKQDGLVSIEVPPYIAYDTSQTAEKAVQLWEKINMPNVMIKIPATNEGIESIKILYQKNININVTLLFSLEKYSKVIETYKNANTQSISVASFFVSRVDTVIDEHLLKLKQANLITEELYTKLVGKTAVFNSLNAFKLYERSFQNVSKIQRILWASTSTKNPSYNPLKYIQELLTPNSINTIPLNTYQLLINSEINLEEWEKITKQNIEQLEEINQKLQQISNYLNFNYFTEELLYKGVTLFSDSYNSIVDTFITQLSINTSPLA